MATETIEAVDTGTEDLGTESDTEVDLNTEDGDTDPGNDDSDLSYEDWLVKDQAKQETNKKERAEKRANENTDDKPDDKPDEKTDDKSDDKDASDDKPDDKSDESKDDEGDKEPEAVEFSVEGQSYKVPAKDVPHLLAKAAGADKRFQEASGMRKEAQDFIVYIKENPVEALKKAGHDFDKLAIEYMHKKFEYAEMNDDQKAAHDSNKKLAQIEAENAKFKERDRFDQEKLDQQKEHERYEAEADKQDQLLGSQIKATLEANPQVPKNKYTISRIAAYIDDAKKKGYDMSPSEVIGYVEQDYKDLMEQTRKTNVAQYKQNQKGANAPGTTSKPKPRAKPKKHFTSIYDMID